MSLLWWAAGEEIEFAVRATGVISNTSVTAGRRTAFTRAALLMPGTIAKGGVESETMPLAAPVTSVWFSCHMYFGAVIALSDTALLGIGSAAAGVGGIYIGARAGANKVALFSIDSSNALTYLTSEPGTTFGNSALHRFDVQITNFNNVAGNVKVYMEGNATPTINYTGDLTGLGFTDLDCIRCLSDGFSDATLISEIIIADEDTRSIVGVASLAPDGAGDTNTFGTGTYAEIDEALLNDTDLIASASNAQEFDCTLSDLPGGTFIVRGVKVADRAVKGGSGPGTQNLGIISGVTTDTVPLALTAGLANYERLMELNPVTGLAWTIAEVNALQAAIVSAA